MSTSHRLPALDMFDPAFRNRLDMIDPASLDARVRNLDVDVNVDPDPNPNPDPDPDPDGTTINRRVAFRCRWYARSAKHDRLLSGLHATLQQFISDKPTWAREMSPGTNFTEPSFVAFTHADRESERTHIYRDENHPETKAEPDPEPDPFSEPEPDPKPDPEPEPEPDPFSDPQLNPTPEKEPEANQPAHRVSRSWRTQHVGTAWTKMHDHEIRWWRRLYRHTALAIHPDRNPDPLAHAWFDRVHQSFHQADFEPLLQLAGELTELAKAALPTAAETQYIRRFWKSKALRTRQCIDELRSSFIAKAWHTLSARVY